ncbi:hypothetical protein [Nocardia carnea]|uniref:DUF1281 family ferredoxin-like fold protein n=1 Tax=Nocardia carnea TaxID=37328 RepID=UPI002457C0D1|nr:hypothetical protein [Nocardia carnea]
MPNWCHNTLTVLGGSAAEVQRFVTAAQPTEALARDHYPAECVVPFDEFLTDFRASQPLMFAALVPEPSQEQYAEMDEAAKTTCRLCGGRGKRPVTAAEAADWGCDFHPGVNELSFDQRPACSVCAGSGRAIPGGSDAWYRWRLTHWGCKWEPQFSRPATAVATPGAGADIGLSTAARGRTDAEAAAVYRFDTPSSPPIPFIAHATEMFPALDFLLAYGEPGIGFAGRLRCRGGELIDHETLDIDDALPAEDMWF